MEEGKTPVNIVLRPVDVMVMVLYGNLHNKASS